MKNSLFDLLGKENLNRLKITYNFKSGRVIIYTAKEWGQDIKWVNYNKRFYTSSILTDNIITLNDCESRELFAKHNQTEYLNEIIDLIKQGKHQFIDCYFNKPKNIRFTNNAHSEVLGLNNRSHAIRAGGIRRHFHSENEKNVIIDGLNLGRGMSFKNFAARIPFGGSKITVIMDELDLTDLESVGFLAYCLDKSRCFTGPDMNFPPELADVMKKHFSLNITGGPGGPLGATGTPTAFGVYLAVKEATKFRFDSDSLKDKKIAVIGLGAVGLPLCEHYLNEGVHLFVADYDLAKIDALISNHPNHKITVTKPDDILYLDVDILSPCANGGIFNSDNINQLKAKIIIGGANNQLKASGKEDEIKLANLIKQKGIIFQVAWWHNGGGVLCGHEEYIQQEKASMKNVLRLTSETCKYTYQNLEEAEKLDISPTENAYRQVEKHIYN